ncbi:MAG: hypothetical protein ABH870_05065 [bacterium]
MSSTPAGTVVITGFFVLGPEKSGALSTVTVMVFICLGCCRTAGE